MTKEEKIPRIDPRRMMIQLSAAMRELIAAARDLTVVAEEEGGRELGKAISRLNKALRPFDKMEVSSPTPDGGGDFEETLKTCASTAGVDIVSPDRVYNESDLPDPEPCDGSGRLHDFNELEGPTSAECPGCLACQP